MTTTDDPATASSIGQRYCGVGGTWRRTIAVEEGDWVERDAVLAELENDRAYDRGVDIMVRANSIKDAALVENSRRTADILIEPAVKHVHWADFTDYKRCIEAGEEAASAMMPAIRKLLRRERWLSPLRRGRGRKLADIQIKAALRRFHME